MIMNSQYIYPCQVKPNWKLVIFATHRIWSKSRDRSALGLNVYGKCGMSVFLQTVSGHERIEYSKTCFTPPLFNLPVPNQEINKGRQTTLLFFQITHFVQTQLRKNFNWITWWICIPSINKHYILFVETIMYVSSCWTHPYLFLKVSFIRGRYLTDLKKPSPYNLSLSSCWLGLMSFY